MIELRSLTKVFGKATAVNSIDLEIQQGEFFSLLGPSGCGKTTTLRMIAGFEQPDAGEVTIEGENVAGLPPYKRPTNTVFQSYALFPHLTVEENVAFGLKRQKVSKDEIGKRVKEAAKILDLDPYLERKPKALSGGQRQRVAMGRAIVRSPQVFLMIINLDSARSMLI